MAIKYIEGRDGEKWQDVTKLFVQWLKLNAPSLNSFGYSEDEPLNHNGRRYFALSIPDRHGEKIALFEAWAKTTARLFGSQSEEQILFSDGTTVQMSTNKAVSLPAWLK